MGAYVLLTDSNNIEQDCLRTVRNALSYLGSEKLPDKVDILFQGENLVDDFGKMFPTNYGWFLSLLKCPTIVEPGWIVATAHVTKDSNGEDVCHVIGNAETGHVNVHRFNDTFGGSRWALVEWS
jgi:hypothetical protein